MAENEIEAAQLFAQYAANLKYEDIPADIREGTKRNILDTLAVTVAGSSQNNQYRALVELIKDSGGKEESTILGFGYRVPSWMAAFANAALNHSHLIIAHPITSLISITARQITSRR